MSTIFNNRDIRRLFTALGIATIFLLLAGQLIAFSLSSSARSVLYTRDTELAGALLDKGLPAEEVADVFTRDLTASEGEAGSALLTREMCIRDSRLHSLCLQACLFSIK